MTSQERKNKILTMHKDNPNIYSAFKKMALHQFGKRKKYYGARAIIELVRWETKERINGGDFKVNNDFSSLCSRLFVKEFPKYEDNFGFRASIFDDKDLDELQLDLFTIDKY